MANMLNDPLIRRMASISDKQSMSTESINQRAIVNGKKVHNLFEMTEQEIEEPNPEILYNKAEKHSNYIGINRSVECITRKVSQRKDVQDTKSRTKSINHPNKINAGYKNHRAAAENAQTVDSKQGNDKISMLMEEFDSIEYKTMGPKHNSDLYKEIAPYAQRPKHKSYSIKIQTKENAYINKLKNLLISQQQRDHIKQESHEIRIKQEPNYAKLLQEMEIEKERTKSTVINPYSLSQQKQVRKKRSKTVKESKRQNVESQKSKIDTEEERRRKLLVEEQIHKMKKTHKINNTKKNELKKQKEHRLSQLNEDIRKIMEYQKLHATKCRRSSVEPVIRHSDKEKLQKSVNASSFKDILNEKPAHEKNISYEECKLIEQRPKSKTINNVPLKNNWIEKEHIKRENIDAKTLEYFEQIKKNREIEKKKKTEEFQVSNPPQNTITILHTAKPNEKVYGESKKEKVDNFIYKNNIKEKLISLAQRLENSKVTKVQLRPIESSTYKPIKESATTKKDEQTITIQNKISSIINSNPTQLIQEIRAKSKNPLHYQIQNINLDINPVTQIKGPVEIEFPKEETDLSLHSFQKTPDDTNVVDLIINKIGVKEELLTDKTKESEANKEVEFTYNKETPNKNLEENEKIGYQNKGKDPKISEFQDNNILLTSIKEAKNIVQDSISEASHKFKSHSSRDYKTEIDQLELGLKTAIQSRVDRAVNEDKEKELEIKFIQQNQQKLNDLKNISKQNLIIYKNITENCFNPHATPVSQDPHSNLLEPPVDNTPYQLQYTNQFQKQIDTPNRSESISQFCTPLVKQPEEIPEDILSSQHINIEEHKKPTEELLNTSHKDSYIYSPDFESPESLSNEKLNKVIPITQNAKEQQELSADKNITLNIEKQANYSFTNNENANPIVANEQNQQQKPIQEAKTPQPPPEEINEEDDYSDTFEKDENKCSSRALQSSEESYDVEVKKSGSDIDWLYNITDSDYKPPEIHEDIVEEETENDLDNKKDQEHSLKLDEMANKIVETLMIELTTSLKSNLYPVRKLQAIASSVSDLGSLPPLKLSRVNIPIPPKPEGIATDSKYISEYLDSIFNLIKCQFATYSKGMSTPITKSPLVMLKQIQDGETGDSISSIISKPIMPAQLFQEIDKTQVKLSNEEAIKNQKIHNRCIFDALNDAFDVSRPLGLTGVPMPWSHKVRDLSYKRSIPDKIMEKAKEKVLEWSKISAGCINDGKGILENINIVSQLGDKIGNQREEKLCKMLYMEVIS